MPAKPEPGSAPVETRVQSQPPSQTRSQLPSQPRHVQPAEKQAPAPEPYVLEERPVPTPPVVFDLIEKASAALYLDQWRQAQHYLEQAQRIAPKEPQVYLYYGDYYVELSQFSEAMHMYERSLSLSAEGSESQRQARFRIRKLQSLPPQ